MTIFCCKVSNTSLIKQIEIDTKTYNTYQSLKNKIADYFQLKTSQFELTNLPTEKQLKKNKGNYDITLTILTPTSNILFKLSKEIIQISNCFQKDYNGVIQQFCQQNIYFSSILLTMLKFKVWDIEIPRFTFLFNCIPEGTIIDVEPHNLVILKYRYFKFVFIEGESVSNVLQFISSIINGAVYYTLQSLPDCTTLCTTCQLSSKQKYLLHITHNFTFCQINRGYFDKTFDYLTTVAELKNTFSVSFSIGCQLTPANIIVYNYKINQNAKDNDRLIDVVTYSQQIGKYVIFFDISYNTQSQFLPMPSLPPQQQQNQQNMASNQHQQKPQNPSTMQSTNSSSDNRRMSTSGGLEIRFIFDNGSGIDFVQNALFDTRIDTLIKSLTDVYRLTGKVEIAYKDKKTNKTVILDHNKTVVDYIDEMMSYGENRLYIETDIKVDKKQQNKPSYVPQKKPTENPEPEENPSSVPPKKTKHPEPEEEPKQPESEKKSERKKIAVKKFKPKVTKTDEVENENESKPSEKKKKDSTQKEPTKYQFKYDDEDRKIKFDDNSYLADNEEKIKQKFEIDDDVEIEYFTINEDDDGDENPIQNLNTLMKKFKNKKILIKKVQPVEEEVHIEEEEEDVEDSSSAKTRYFYQVNSESETKFVDLIPNAKVIDLKKVIKKRNGVKNVDNIKILFAGKDLLDNLELKSLDIGSTILFVYIRTEEDILLMTAKALRIPKISANDNGDD